MVGVDLLVSDFMEFVRSVAVPVLGDRVGFVLYRNFFEVVCLRVGGEIGYNRITVYFDGGRVVVSFSGNSIYMSNRRVFDLLVSSPTIVAGAVVEYCDW